MRQRGKISASQLNVINLQPHRDRVRAPHYLEPKQRDIFDEAVASMPANFFVQSDTILLGSLAQTTDHMLRLSTAMQHDSNLTKAWERLARVQALLLTKLRMTPRSRFGAKTTARRTSQPALSAYQLDDADT